MLQQSLRTSSLLLVCALVVTSCATPQAATTPTPDPTTDAQSPSPDEAPGWGGTTTFSVAGTGAAGFSDAPLLAAVDLLRSEGYEIEVHEIADPNLMVAGTAEGEFHFSSGDAAALLRAIEAGGDLRLIGERVGDEWAIVTVADITQCEDLHGRTVAYHAVGSFNEVSVRAYIEENCPGTEPTEVIIAGSENRAAALLAGELDSSPVELADAINILQQGGDQFRILASFNESLPDLRFAPLAVNGQFLEENPGTARAFLEALLTVNRRIIDEPGYLQEIALEYIPSVNEEILDETVEQYLRFGLFDPNGGVTESNLNYTIQFFVDAETIGPGLSLDEVADLSHLEAVLEEIGRR